MDSVPLAYTQVDFYREEYFTFLQWKCHLLVLQKVALIYDSLAYVYSNTIWVLKSFFQTLWILWLILEYFPLISILLFDSRIKIKICNEYFMAHTVSWFSYA